MRLVLAGGGSAGHINPMLSVAEEAQKRGFLVSIIASSTGIDQNLLNKKKHDVVFIKKIPFPRIPCKKDILSLSDLLLFINFLKKTLVFPVAFLLETRKCIKILKIRKTDAVLGFGGFVSAPVYLASKILKIPLYIHEANSKMGLSNKLGSRFAKIVFTAFPEIDVKTTKCQFVGLPLRKEFLTSLDGKNKYNKNKIIKLRPSSKLTLLVFGGSLGAKSINQAVYEALPDLLKICNIIHITGLGKNIGLTKVNEAQKFKQKNLSYIQLEYCNDMASVLKESDFAIARAGAGTVLEFASMGLAACFVPLPIGNGEQSLNANYLVKANAAIICDDAHFTSKFIKNTIIPLLKNSKKIAQMGQNAKNFGVFRADEKIVKIILSDIKNKK
ncbi:MAG: UDP-N-acetylglucosamine--N-acetylmuramyl-(pentapeptide) pyrophosphoryl-undecaprenol N-acetylglucosamine transferase [Bifidobacteriaceae bacterium]|jgi:UDP-N-acetylglucosamine--N-acetylmuramyl-(pentapeptide) pyrophosphoryl-undecaprenol N-acetylglucosamine transferase|nr:UDP-N-acetylglucosamine--N-acetylmuramyl-(pentapeptide) pyrophosphoryl-undecaprenol N-acetylglucosamine transferase [Bifidobacteriaceae bacterium]